jgi:hypothetical protein
MENHNKLHSYVVAIIVVLLAILALLFVPMTIRAQETETSSGGFFCTVLFGGCDNSSSNSEDANTETPINVAPTSPENGGFWSNLFGGSSNTKVTAVISIVSVPGSDEVYRIVSGKKHLIPNEEIFASYGLKLSMINAITAAELAKYPQARLFRVQGDESLTIYYLTSGGMIRPMINNKAFYSYGNRKEDVITINLKEFNFYPRNQYVFVDRPFVNRDIYQITSGVKRYVTPAAVSRMNIQAHEIAPVSIVELEEYQTSDPVIY